MELPRRLGFLGAPRLIIVFTCCCGVLAGCGGESKPDRALTGPELAVKNFYDALGAGDVAGACAVLTPGGVDSMMSVEEPGSGSRICASPPQLEPQPELSEAVSINGSEVTGDVATVRVDVGLDDEPENEVRVVDRNGTWLIDSTINGGDQTAMANAYAALLAVEKYRQQHGSFLGLSSDVIVAADPRLTGVPLDIQADAAEYQLSVESGTGNVFSISGLRKALPSYSCTEAGEGDCPETGNWTFP